MGVASVNWVGLQIEGNLIAPDLTAELLAGEVKGQASENFGFGKSDKLADEIAIAWGDAKAYWTAFQRMLARLPEEETATTITREYWVVPLLRSLGFDPMYVRNAEVVDGQTYAISHRAEAGEHKPPIHVVGCRIDLEKRPPSGNPRLSAHALVQEYLNRTEHLWAIVTNGLRWRLLRDSSLMTRLTYVEFDLEQILNGENFAEFSLFYRLFHRSRLPQGMEDADECLLEFYHQESLQQGGRVRDRLRDGVEKALIQFGTGVLQHKNSEGLRSRFASGELTAADYYRQLLMLIYRLLFLMVAESRELLLSESEPEKQRIYREYYSVERLRLLAERPSWRREGFQDLWHGLQVTFKLMDENWRGRVLGLSPLNGDLFGSESLADLETCGLDNHDFLAALRGLSLYEHKGQLRRVNYAALNVEELGSVYEALFDFHPIVKNKNGIYQFLLVAGSERKTTGSYYTPKELVNQLIKSALEPVIEQRLSGLELAEDKEKALLKIKVCDPACGSGHFLLAAARRIGLELARIRTGEFQPGQEAWRLATRAVIQNCIYGVDLNPLAIDLCKVALWVEGFYRGYPLTFLNHKIKCGNSLVGVLDFDCLAEIPDDAYKPVTGDDKSLATALRKRNKKERENPSQLIVGEIVQGIKEDIALLAHSRLELSSLPERTATDVKHKEDREEEIRKDWKWWQNREFCNLWTSAFFTQLTHEKLAIVPTSERLHQYKRDPKRTQKTIFPLTPYIEAANQVAQEKRFFHWALEFPEVFEQGGFDCVLGNPPWERIKLLEKEFFAARSAEIASAANKSERERLIRRLSAEHPELLQTFQSAKHDSDAQGKFIRGSNRFSLTSVGDVNTYAIFSETVKNIISQRGLAGIIIPTGIATDDTCKRFFGELSSNQTLVSLYDFENRENLFNGVGHGRFKFALLSISGSKMKGAKFAFFATNVRHLENPKRVFQLTSQDIALLNPNTLTCSVLRTKADAELTKKIYEQVPVLENEKTGKNPWGITFSRMFDMSNDSGLFRNEPGDKLVPLCEAKMFHYFNHRFGDYADYPEGALTSHLPDIPDDRLANPKYVTQGRYWVEQSELDNRLASVWNKKWLLAFRGITNATNERCAIFTTLPRVALGNSAPAMFFDQKYACLATCLQGNLSSLVFDFVARQKVGGANFNFFIVKQLPVLPPETYTQSDIDFIAPRVLELVYTAWDMKPFAEDMGYTGVPFIWNPDRRAQLRAELDAYYAHLYGLDRDELRYILDPTDVYGADFPSETFRVLKNNEIKQFGEYRTQRLVLEAWDKMFSKPHKLRSR